ncbi:MAG: hydrolase [Methylomonas sp.]|nr:MAG: hydrolase [Methylomonas sp.]
MAVFERIFSLSMVLLAIMMVSGCASDSKNTAFLPVPQAQSQAVSYALSLQGTPYRYGKDSPEEGFDCSGFVKHVYQRQGVDLPRSAQEMAEVLPNCPVDELRAGDLIFFDTNGDEFSHVGLYLGDRKFIHAPSRRTGKVLISDFGNDYWQKHFTGARRPISAD